MIYELCRIVAAPGTYIIHILRSSEHFISAVFYYHVPCIQPMNVLECMLKELQKLSIAHLENLFELCCYKNQLQ